MLITNLLQNLEYSNIEMKNIRQISLFLHCIKLIVVFQLFQIYMDIKETIPKSDSDLLLESWGYNLIDEYLQLIKAANFVNSTVLDVATGTGRASSVLSRLKYNVITGDNCLDKKSEAERRITENYFSCVKFLKLNLGCLPFGSGSINNIVCLNTLHELSDPVKCLKEIIRVHSSNGTMLIADFNLLGFDVMDRLHLTKFNRWHPRGSISTEVLLDILRKNYFNINRINTELNSGFIVIGKR